MKRNKYIYKNYKVTATKPIELNKNTAIIRTWSLWMLKRILFYEYNILDTEFNYKIVSSIQE